MKREEKFVQSHQPYAVDLGSYHVGALSEHGSAWCRVNAVWFRRRRSGYNGPLQTVACAGDVHTLLRPPSGTAEAFLLAHTDGRYGGDCQARWDGTELWAPGMSEPTRVEHLAVLRPMLEAYPELPEGFDGWWTFR